MTTNTWRSSSPPREDQMTMAEWVRQALRQARQRRRKQVDVKLRVLEEACRHEAPTADIETMLDEIEQGYQSGDFH